MFNDKVKRTSGKSTSRPGGAKTSNIEQVRMGVKTCNQHTKTWFMINIPECQCLDKAWTMGLARPRTRNLESSGCRQEAAKNWANILLDADKFPTFLEYLIHLNLRCKQRID
ncbi:predicted protein [Coccidioides posadasii str. Silveira]|uniref:Predicted protein n=2 Tax=Coccidioides posadasii TaxID=199306 RepID=E9DA94_COCPS|nr:predicted protein [Coccidioides posadasii str. Silveira]KMM64411.1 hypothetical protein CPAG_00763 [Coccidioides posadasii RMSCC 3488]